MTGSNRPSHQEPPSAGTWVIQPPGGSGTGTGRTSDQLPDWMLAPKPERPRGRWRRLMDRIGPAAIRDRIAHRYVRTTKIFSGIAAAVVLLGAIALIWAGYAQFVKADPTDAPTAPTQDAREFRDAFAGTPAVSFPVGAAGITLPSAAPAGPFDTNAVTQALGQVKEALMAARIDERMLVDHNPDRFLSLLRPSIRPARTADFRTAAFATFATQIADGTALGDQPPRVRGTMSYRLIGPASAPVLEITTNFVWVYPMVFPDGRPVAVVVHDRLVWHRIKVDDTSTDFTGARHVALAGSAATIVNADCAELTATGRLAPKPVGAGQPAADLRNAYNPGHPIASGIHC